MGAYSNVIDLGELFGLKQQVYASDSGPLVQHSTNDPLIVSSGSVGYNMGNLWDHFPNTMAMLKEPTGTGGLNWSDDDCLSRTYPWFAVVEAGFLGQGGLVGGNGKENRDPIYIPQGVWRFNSEIRVCQSPYRGSGQGWNYGSGGTNLILHSAGWKSLYGAQNNGMRALITPFVYRGEQAASGNSKLAPYGVDEWSHFLRLQDMRLIGTATNTGFWNPAEPVETGCIFHNPGEGSGTSFFSACNFRGFGYMVSGSPAPFAADNNEIFYNWIGGVGVRGGAHSKISFYKLSGDNNPWMVFVYKSGSNALGTGSFLPSVTGGSPGGNISFNDCKIEAMAWRNGYPGFATPGNPALGGKGGMWARLTGRFTFSARDSTLNVHKGKIWTAIEMLDDDWMGALYPGQGFGGLPPLNSRIEITNCQLWGVKNYMADWCRQRVVPMAAMNNDVYSPSMYWSNQDDSAKAFRLGVPNNVELATSPAAWRGTQPLINEGQVVDWAPGAAPTFNYNIITGANF